MSSSEPASSAVTRSTVLVVDDDTRERAQLCAIVNAAGAFAVVAQASSGYEAIRAIHEHNPDIVALDLERDGDRSLDLLGYIMAESPRPVIVLSEQALPLPHPVLNAIDFSAIEFVVKPASRGTADSEILQRRLLAALDAAANARIGGLRIDRAKRAAARASRAARRAGRTGTDASGPPAQSAVAIAASTGGPRALLEVVPQLPEDLPAAVLIVQHMPAGFTRLLAERLDRVSRLTVREASAGEVLKAGVVYLAPGGVHMALQRTAGGISVTREETEPVWGLRPAADVLFGAVARHFGPRSMGLVLTGMGRDGANGLRAIREVGGWTAVQDVASAVVSSMPRAAAPHAVLQLPLENLARAIATHAAQLSRTRTG
jgi:two-component system chemotaxis response regulator CheB